MPPLDCEGAASLYSSRAPASERCVRLFVGFYTEC